MGKPFSGENSVQTEVVSIPKKSGEGGIPKKSSKKRQHWSFVTSRRRGREGIKPGWGVEGN